MASIPYTSPSGNAGVKKGRARDGHQNREELSIKGARRRGQTPGEGSNFHHRGLNRIHRRQPVEENLPVIAFIAAGE